MRFWSISVIAKISISQSVVAVLPLQGIIIETGTISSIFSDRKVTRQTILRCTYIAGEVSSLKISSLERKGTVWWDEELKEICTALTLSFASLLFASSIIDRKREWPDGLSQRSCRKPQLVVHSKMNVRVSRSSDYSLLFMRKSATSVMLWCSNVHSLTIRHYREKERELIGTIKAQSVSNNHLNSVVLTTIQYSLNINSYGLIDRTVTWHFVFLHLKMRFRYLFD